MPATTSDCPGTIRRVGDAAASARATPRTNQVVVRQRKAERHDGGDRDEDDQPDGVCVSISQRAHRPVIERSPGGRPSHRELAGDRVFRIALVNSLVFAAVAVPLRLGAALGLALLLHRGGRGVGVARSAVVLPTIVPELAYGLLWLWLLNPLYGPVNGLLTAGGENGATVLGRQPPQWLTDPNDARIAMVLLALFTIGEGFVLLLVARRAVPSDLYELAALEDATWWDVFWRITLRLMLPVLVLLGLRDLVLSLQLNLVPALVVTDGGPPDHATTYLGLFVYRNAFEYLRYGYAAAATAVLVLMTAAIVVVQLWLLRRWRRAVI